MTRDWNNYQISTYNDEVCNLLIEFLEKYNVDNAVDLGCGAGNETVYMVKKGINVTACDIQLNKEFILDRLNDIEKEKVKFIESDFENIKIPKTTCVCAFLVYHFVIHKNLNLSGTKYMNQ